MQNLGIVRKIDELGRIVIPIEIRNSLDIKTRDSMEILVEEDKIILKKYEPRCIFCGSREKTFIYKGKLICERCRDSINKAK
ncbi:MAG: AbrB/MazE/SpoVT family DNA-binding domain-containing protein [Ruminococcaceae bacterium]|nr:AbrB/MazE/SpoVT family DNA-binding domain-containing protein [Oscillospiraceae bacterium]